MDTFFSSSKIHEYTCDTTSTRFSLTVLGLEVLKKEAPKRRSFSLTTIQPNTKIKLNTNAQACFLKARSLFYCVISLVGCTLIIRMAEILILIYVINI